MRRFGPITAFMVLALLGWACGEPAPSRQTFVVPTEVIPEWINTSDVEELFPADAGCLLAVGGGARVLEVLDGTPADGLLRVGDIVTSVDGIRTSSLEMLLQVVDGRSGGDIMVVEMLRAGEPLSIEIELSAAPSEPGRAILGIISETKLDPAPPADLSESTMAGPFTRPVILNGWIYLYEPLAAAWSPYPGVPADRMAALGSEIYAVAANDPLSLVSIGEGQSIPIDPGPVVFDSMAGPVEVSATSFESALTSVGDLVLVAGEASSGGTSLAFALHAVDPVTRTVVWTRPLGLSQSGNPLVAVDGHRSPSGNRALVALVEYDFASGSRSGLWSYYLVDEQGEGLVGPDGIDRFLPTAGVTGWYDETSLLYVVDSEIPQVARWDLATGDHSIIWSLTAEEAHGLVTVTPVGDGKHVVQVQDSGVSLINVSRPEAARPISRGCRHVPMGGMTG